MYDVIVVGARVAGASTAMLLARRGLSVLALDRAEFPSDTLSTHQGAGAGRGPAAPLGTARPRGGRRHPPAGRVRFDPGPVVLECRCLLPGRATGRPAELTAAPSRGQTP